jgi:hypothetical protein
MQRRVTASPQAPLPSPLGALPEGFAGARLLSAASDALGTSIRLRDLKFFWKVTMAVTKMAKLSPMLPPII